MAKQSLFQKTQQETPTGAIATLPAMGGGLTAVQTPEKETYSNYLIFMHRDKGKWADVSREIPGLQDGDAVLFEDGAPRKVTPLVFFLLDIHQYWCVLDAEYKPRKVWTVKPEDSTYYGSRVVETLSTAILVQHGGELIPCTARFTGAMCQGVYKAKDCAIRDAASPEWAANSPDHAATLSIPQPNLRFKSELTVRPKKAKSGYMYHISDVKISPTSAGDAKLFGSLDRDKVELMREAFDSHKQDIMKLV